MLMATCSSCGRTYGNLKAELFGKLVRCKCGIQIQIPELLSEADVLEEVSEADIKPIVVQPIVVQPIRSQPVYPPAKPPTEVVRKDQRRNRRKKSTGENSRGTFRGVDIIYMVVGVLAALHALSVAWNTIEYVIDMATLEERRFANVVEVLGDQAKIDGASKQRVTSGKCLRNFRYFVNSA